METGLPKYTLLEVYVAQKGEGVVLMYRKWLHERLGLEKDCVKNMRDLRYEYET